MSQTVGGDTEESDPSAGGEKDTNVGGSNDVSVCDKFEDSERDTKDRAGVNEDRDQEENDVTEMTNENMIHHVTVVQSILRM